MIQFFGDFIVIHRYLLAEIERNAKTLKFLFRAYKSKSHTTSPSKDFTPSLSFSEQWSRIETHSKDAISQAMHLLEMCQSAKERLDSLSYTLEQLNQDLEPLLQKQVETPSSFLQNREKLQFSDQETPKLTSKIAA